EIPLGGNSHYFIRLLGDPKLTLATRRHDINQWLASGLWASLCIALTAMLVFAFTRTQVSIWLRSSWPWLAVAIGCAWLFLLPLGLAGCVLIAVGASVAAWRTRRPRQVQPRAV